MVQVAVFVTESCVLLQIIFAPPVLKNFPCGMQRAVMVKSASTMAGLFHSFFSVSPHPNRMIRRCERPCPRHTPRTTSSRTQYMR